MSIWKISGGNVLDGDVTVQGSKNAVLPIMAASILGGGKVTLHSCPSLLDVDASMEILRHLGCEVEKTGSIIEIDPRNAGGTHIPHELMLKMRSSVMFLGAILARNGETRLSSPGGCELGSRPIDLHLAALRMLGAEIREEGGELFCRADRLHGAQINLDFPSVGATENAMLAACAANGKTVITNAAREPEIVDLQRFLVLLGGNISGAGTSVITIEGFEKRLDDAEYTIMPDRIAASTYLCAAAAAGGDICVKNVHIENIQTVLSSLDDMGCGIIYGQNAVRLKRKNPLTAPRPVITRPYPGFPTDAQALLMAACLKARGTSVFVENIFENRYRHADELRRLGADIKTEGRVAMITGVDRLVAARLHATDLRGGAAMVLAGLSAEGETTVYDAGHIRRGYESLDASLRALGARVERTE